jgi:hypothetical protein
MLVGKIELTTRYRFTRATTSECTPLLARATYGSSDGKTSIPYAIDIMISPAILYLQGRLSGWVLG